jgi:hypothetical protein
VVEITEAIGTYQDKLMEAVSGIENGGVKKLVINK